MCDKSPLMLTPRHEIIIDPKTNKPVIIERLPDVKARTIKQPYDLIELFPSWGKQKAAYQLKRILNSPDLSDEAKRLIQKFIEPATVGANAKAKDGQIQLRCAMDFKSRMVKAAQKDPETGSLSKFIIRACEEKLERMGQ